MKRPNGLADASTEGATSAIDGGRRVDSASPESSSKSKAGASTAAGLPTGASALEESSPSSEGSGLTAEGSGPIGAPTSITGTRAVKPSVGSADQEPALEEPPPEEEPVETSTRTPTHDLLVRALATPPPFRSLASATTVTFLVAASLFFSVPAKTSMHLIFIMVNTILLKNTTENEASCPV